MSKLQFTEGEIMFDGVAVGDLVAEGHDDFWTSIQDGEAVYLPSEARYEPWDGEAVTNDSEAAKQLAFKAECDAKAAREHVIGNPLVTPKASRRIDQIMAKQSRKLAYGDLSWSARA